VNVDNQFYLQKKDTLEALLFLNYTTWSYTLQITALVFRRAVFMQYPEFLSFSLGSQIIATFTQMSAIMLRSTSRRMLGYYLLLIHSCLCPNISSS
jgi:hypothetical protein